MLSFPRSLLPLSYARSSAIALLACCCVADRAGAQPAWRSDTPRTVARVAARGDGPRRVPVRTRTPARTREASRAPLGLASSTSSPSPAPGTDRDRLDEALRAYQASGVARPVTLGSSVAYPFGHGTPLVTCAVLRVCVVELERGETVVDEPLAGDQARWIIQTARAGPGGRDALVVVKPTACDLATNLVIPTDRRIYDLSLESAPCDAANTRGVIASLTRRVSFYYPDGSTTPTPVRNASAPPVDRGSMDAAAWPTIRNTHYRVVRTRRGPFGLFGHKPIDFPWTPRAIVDDGARVYVVAPPEARPHAAPVLYALEEDGSRTMVNVAVRGDTLVSDRTFRRGVLVLAAGSREQRLTFENRAWRTHPAATPAPQAAQPAPGAAPPSGRGGP